MEERRGSYAPLIVIGLGVVLAIAAFSLSGKKKTTGYKTVDLELAAMGPDAVNRALAAIDDYDAGLISYDQLQGILAGGSPALPTTALTKRPTNIKMLAYEPPATQQAAPVEELPSTIFYENEEKWHIEWNEEGFPTDITVKRRAQRA